MQIDTGGHAMRSPITLFAVTLLLAIAAAAQAPEPKVAASNPQFNALKTLAGDWTLKTPDGKTATETYRVVSGNSAIILDQHMPGEEGSMITMFHPDGQKTVATHYCAMGNQPRMVAEASSDTKTIPFKFKDITNDDGKSGSMRELTIVLIDNDHHNQVWTWQDAKGGQQTETFKYTRTHAPNPGE
jgi:hypothetical protein